MTTRTDRAALLPTGLLIGDEWVQSTSVGEMDHVNPATGVKQRSFPIAGAAEVDAAVAAARAALPAWRAWTPDDRRDVLRRIAGLLRAKGEEFGLIGSLETGLVRALSNWMSPSAATWFDYYAGWADKVQGDLITIPGSFNYTLPEPIGVAAIMVTWNGPAGAVGMACAAPLAAGCTVVLKAPELSPFSCSLFGRLCLEAGLPPGVLNVIVGGPEAGDALVSHPGVNKIAFTGSAPTARLIQAACARSLTPTLFELGGKSANIVFADADIAASVAVAAGGVTMLNGQTCIAPTRLLVQRAIYEDVLAAVAEQMKALSMGDPLDPQTGMGPVISAGARDRIIDMIATAENTGAGSVVAGGSSVDSSLGDGFFVTPTVFRDVDNGSAIAQNEIFGPVLAAIPFDDEEEAVALANDTHYALAAYLSTRDLDRAHRVAARLDAGNIAVNGGNPMCGPWAPFGGFGASGHGKQGGGEGLREFLRVKNVNIRSGS
jgi:aldehyde dehydrogenase (NAD+)